MKLTSVFDLEYWLANPRFALLFAIAPLAMLVAAFAFLIIPLTHDRMEWLMDEDRLVEFMTFVFLFIAGCLALELARRAWVAGDRVVVIAFYALFAVGCIFAAGEEIAWGQHYLDYATPEEWAALNKQGEVTFHNLPWLHGKTELLRLSFGLGGLIGVWLAGVPFFRNIGAQRALVPWFAVILGHGVVDLTNDFVSIQAQFDDDMSSTSELIEMMIGMTAMFYVSMNFRPYRVASRAP